MKFKLVVLDVKLPQQPRRWGIRVGAALTVLLGGGAVASASIARWVLHASAGLLPDGGATFVTWDAGQTLLAGDLNGDFAYLQQQISAQAVTIANQQLAIASLQTPACPFGYEQVDAGGPVECVSGQDELVRVGVGASAFWIDAFEAILVDTSGATYVDASQAQVTSTFPANGQWTGRLSPFHAESRIGVTPTSNITWFQANTACRAAGKRLPTGSEWLEAARGTVDPGLSSGVAGECHTQSGPTRTTGLGIACSSGWGAQDMIGNLTEWSDDWWAGVGDASQTAAWPDAGAAYNQDGTWNIASTAGAVNSTSLGLGLPSAASRGGSWNDGVSAGVFALNLDNAPTYWDLTHGFRCLVPR